MFVRSEPPVGEKDEHGHLHVMSGMTEPHRDMELAFQDAPVAIGTDKGHKYI